MKVLWFTNTPSLSATHLDSKSVGGGWITSLETALSNVTDFQLAVCFNHEQDIAPFTIGKTRYYPVYIKNPNSKIGALLSRWQKPILDEKNIQPYLEVIDQFCPDLIHIFGTEGVFGLISNATETPCIIHLQGILTVCDQKWYSGFTAFDVVRYTSRLRFLKGFGLHHNYLINKRLAKREQQIFQACNSYIGRTDWDKRITSVLSPSSLYFHCDEIMRPQFYKKVWKPLDSPRNNVFTILSTMRNNIYKGLETVVECKQLLNKLNVGGKFEWRIAGIEKNDEIVRIVERKYKCNLSEKGINLIGLVNEEELIKQMLAAQLFVHPSHIDNSPNSVCEAMLLGMPIIATFAGGIPTIVKNKKEGLLVQDGEPYAMAGAILELYNNPHYSYTLGSNARDTAMGRHNPQKIVEQLLNIYSATFSKKANTEHQSVGTISE